MLNKLKNYFWRIYRLNNPDYKDGYYGSFDKIRLFFINFFKPGRFINRLRYGQIFKNPDNKIKLFSKFLKENSLNIPDEKKEKLNQGLKNLLNDGGCVIDNYFSEKEIVNFKKNYEDVINILKIDKDKDIDTHNTEILPLTESLINLWLDEGLISLLNIYHGRQIYARNYPVLIYSKVSSYFNDDKKINNIKKLRWAKDWHVDHSVLFNVHLVLDDINKNCSRMQILQKSDKFNHYGSSFSEEIVNKTNLKKIDCIGKAGTVYLHTGNVVHRFFPEPGSDRLVGHFEFSPGSNILMNTKGIIKCFKKNFDIDSISQEKMNIIYPIFPRDIFKGYDVKNNTFTPTKFRGI